MHLHQKCVKLRAYNVIPEQNEVKEEGLLLSRFGFSRGRCYTLQCCTMHVTREFSLGNVQRANTGNCTVIMRQLVSGNRTADANCSSTRCVFSTTIPAPNAQKRKEGIPNFTE